VKNPQITNRDIAILLDVYKYRYLSLTQLQTLHFPSLRTVQRRTKALTTLGYLKAFRAPSIPERIFYLDKKGADIVAIELHVEVEDLQWYRYTKAPKDYHFLKHFLSINDFRILLTQACINHPIQLVGFIPEYFGEKTIQGDVKKYIRDKVCDVQTNIEYSHTPDAVFALQKNESSALFFLEVDRGIEVISGPQKGLLKAVVFYLNYWIDGKYQRYSSDFLHKPFRTFRSLFIVPSAQRLQHLREEVTKLPFTKPDAKRFLWGTTASQLTKHTVFDPIWLSLDVNDISPHRIG
jgi:Replication-relaxation